MSKILIIDDEAPIRSMLKDILEDEGYEVVEAENGEVGISQYRNDPTDVVITDIVMPDKEGIATIRELKKEFPDIKIIAMSGGGRGGADDYLLMAEAFGEYLEIVYQLAFLAEYKNLLLFHHLCQESSHH